MKASAFALLAVVAALPLGGATRVLAQEPSPGSDTLAPALGLADEIVWTAGSLGRLLAERDYPGMLFVSALGKSVESDGERALDGIDPLLSALVAAPSDAGSAFDARASSLAGAVPSAQLDECRAEPDPRRGTLCSMERLVPLAPPALGRQLTEQGAHLMGLYSTPGPTATNLRVARPDAPTSYDPLQAFAEEALQGAWRVRMHASEDSTALAPRMDALLSGVVGFAPADGARAVLDRSPELARMLSAHPVMAPQLASTALAPLPRSLSVVPGSGGAADAVVSGYRGFLGSVAGSLGGLAAGRPSIIASLAGTLGPSASASAAEWAAGRSFVYLAARSAELAGAELGVPGRIRTLGGAAVDLQRGAASLPSHVASRGRQLAITALTGNVLGFASSITSFFQGGSGGLGRGAADELSILRGGVETLGREVETGFAGVDERFDDLFRDLDVRFARLEGLVVASGRSVQEELVAVHRDMVALGSRIDRMDEDVRSYVQAGFERDFGRTLVRCLEHRERYAPPWDQMDFATFSTCLADIRARAVDEARDALLTDQSTPVDDVALAQALSDPSLQNLSRRLPLLARVAEQRFERRSAAAGRGLANPVEWAVATQAYLSLLRDWPDHARAVTTADLEAMRSLGIDLERALLAITSEDAPGAGPLLSQVLRSYEMQVADLTREAGVLARQHRQEGLRRVAPQGVLTTITHVGDDGPALRTPQTIAAAIPQEVRTAVVLGLDTATLTYQLTREDSIVRGGPRRRWLMFGKRHERFTYTRVSVRVALRVGSLTEVATYSAEGPYRLRRTDEIAGDHRSDRSLRGVDHMPDPEASFIQETWPALAAETDTWTTHGPEPFAIELLEYRIDDELRQHATLGLDYVFAEACGDRPGSYSLASADRESATRIRRVLGGLSTDRALLRAYARLGLPTSVAEGQLLREELFGADAIVDGPGLCALIALNAHPLRLIWLDEEPARRASALRSALEPVLERAQAYPEPLSFVASALEQLDVAIRIQRLRALAAPAGG